MRPVLSLLALLGSAACVGTLPPVSPNAAPGTIPADPRSAAEIFHAACIETLPDFAGTPAAMAGFPVTKHTSSGTYYHNTLNLSVKLIEADCSIVFALAGDASDGVVAFARRLDALTSDTDVSITLGGTPQADGLFHANARTTRTQ